MNLKSKTQNQQPLETKLMRYTWWLVVVWSLSMFTLLTRDISSHKEISENIAIMEARSLFQKDEAFRFWAATHGGVYVPVSERTSPSPYLDHIFERDIETPSGIKLTLMNPAWALRQLNEDYSKTYGAAGHIPVYCLYVPKMHRINGSKMPS